jgi:hypothetical protein
VRPPAPPALLQLARAWLSGVVVISLIFATSMASAAEGVRATKGEVAFVVSAPVFRGWLQDPWVAQVVARAPLDDALADALFAADRTGDRLLAALNAAGLVQRRSGRELEDWLWRAVRRRHAVDAAAPVNVAQLGGVEAVALAYAGALDHRGLATPAESDDAARALPARLFAHGRSLLPGDALLGPLLANGHLVDVERARSACGARQRVDALRFVIHKGALPTAARVALVQALDAVAAQCSTPTR